MKNKLFEIRLANKNEINLIINFINEHWERNHFFVNNIDFFNWQYTNFKKKKINFLLAIKKKTNSICSILGFIPFSKFDESNNDEVCWMSLWKTSEEAKGLGLGRELMNELEKTYKKSLLSTVGANFKTLEIYKKKGFIVGSLNHYYLINKKKNNFKLIKLEYAKKVNIHAKVNEINKHKKIFIADINDINLFFNEQNLDDIKPKKTKNYLINRYLKHPIYNYNVLKIIEKDKILGIVIIRKCVYKQFSALRIIDFIGRSMILKGLYQEWQKLLTKYNSEYVDFYNIGIKHLDLTQSGFEKREEMDKVIIPNHYEPFEQKNVDILFMISKSKYKSFRIFKGDSDQDRPSIRGDSGFE